MDRTAIVRGHGTTPDKSDAQEERQNAEREIVCIREQEWKRIQRGKWLALHKKEASAWLAQHRSISTMPIPLPDPPDMTPNGGFIEIRAQSGRGYFIIAADGFDQMSKRAKQKLLDYANK